MNNENEIIERLAKLEAANETKDREIKELKEKQEVLMTSFNTLALTNQTILTKMDNLTEKLNPIAAYIEELKTQPKKELNKFIWLIIGMVLNFAGIAIAFYFKK